MSSLLSDVKCPEEDACRGPAYCEHEILIGKCKYGTKKK